METSDNRVNTVPSIGCNLGVVDWEFAGKGRGINGDVADFLGCLQPFMIPLESVANREAMTRAAKSLLAGFCDAYRTHSKQFLLFLPL